MSNLVSFKSANLPSVQSLSTALRAIQLDTGSTGTVFLKMDKTGAWVFGADSTEIDDDSTWAINPFSFIHGYIAWGDGETLGEKMVSVAEPLPEVGPAPDGAKMGWQQQVGFNLKCLSGQDEGMEARFTTTSFGGKRFVQELAMAIAAQVDKDSSKPVPVVKLDKSHYAHKAYGKIMVPTYKLIEWVSMDGEAQAEPEVEADSVQATTEGRRRRRAE